MKKIFTIVLMFVTSVAHADWSYEEVTDRMTSKIITYAGIQSANSLNLGFPYKGQNYGLLTVRQHPQHGLDVTISIDKGQILCSSYNGCPVEVRFDGKTPIRFSGSGTADRSSTRVFLNNVPRFISEAKKANRILVSMNVYQEGAPVLEFYSTAPLEWGKKAVVVPKKAAASRP